MRNFQDSFETCKESFIRDCSVCTGQEGHAPPPLHPTFFLTKKNKTKKPLLFKKRKKKGTSLYQKMKTLHCVLI